MIPLIPDGIAIAGISRKSAAGFINESSFPFLIRFNLKGNSMITHNSFTTVDLQISI